MSIKKTGKRLLDWLVVVLGLILIISFSRDILRLLGSDDRVNEAKLKVEELEREKASLKEQEDYYVSEEFIEEQARNRLNMGREGEVVVLLPPNVSELVKGEVLTPPPPVPNWKKWWGLFF